MKLFSKLISLIFFSLVYTFSVAQTNVLTQHNNLKRTGWNNTESILTPANVSGGNFGKIFSRSVDGQIYAQPLVVSNLKMQGANHNIVFVATVHNSVYAFDADSINKPNAYWKISLTYNPNNTNAYRPIKNTDMTGACGGGYRDFSGEMGIVGTPVIDSGTNTMYVVSRSVSKADAVFVQYLHAIDITTGLEKAGSPVYITASVNANGDGSDNGILKFDEQHENQRPGLLLYNGVVYISWASHCDWSPYHGWIIGYDAATLQQKYVYNASPNGGLAGIWMSGQAPAVDDNGSIYVTTGNGTVGKNGNANDTTERGESLIKLSTSSGTLKVTDFFTPNDYQSLNDQDLDYGSDGVMLIPNTSLSLSGSKESYLYLINNNKMGGYKNNNSNVLQLLNVNASSTDYDKHIHGSPVYFMDANKNEFIYAWAEGGLLKQFPFNRSKLLFDTLNKIVGYTTLPEGMPGAMLSLSSNGETPATGVLWASHPINGDANQSTVPGILQAFDAGDITHELWNSNLDGQRDGIGNFAKYVNPTIANGKVYMATFSNSLNVYGLNPPVQSSCPFALPAPWKSADLGYVAESGDVCDSSGTFTITASGNDIWDNTDAFHYVYQPATANSIQITARIKSIQNTDSWAKCGIMFRANLDAGSPNVFMTMTVGNGVAFQNRSSQNGVSASKFTGSTSAPYWVRIIKTGNKYVGYSSADGTAWNAFDSVTLSLGTLPYVGLAYTTHDNDSAGIAVADNVSVIINGSLPVDVISFSAQNENNKFTQILWTTVQESNNNNFVVERSGNATDFAPLSTISGKGSTSSINTYTFNDMNPLNGKNFYRLKEVDANGSYKYSKTVLVSFDLNNIEIFPNPVQTQFFIRNNSNFSNNEPLAVQITNTLGQTVYSNKSASSAIITIRIPPGLQQGIYVVKVINAHGEIQARKIFIQQ